MVLDAAYSIVGRLVAIHFNEFRFFSCQPASGLLLVVQRLNKLMLLASKQ